MPTSNPVTGEERAAIVEAIKAGGTCRQVATDFGRSTSTISRIASKEGLAFDRARTEKATKAKQADNRARRAQLAPIFLEKAEHALAKVGAALDQMEGPTLVFNFGGRDNTYEEHILDKPPVETLKAAAATVRDLMQAAKTAQTAVLDAERIDQPQSRHCALEDLVDAIRRARG